MIEETTTLLCVLDTNIIQEASKEEANGAFVTPDRSWLNIETGAVTVCVNISSSSTSHATTYSSRAKHMVYLGSQERCRLDPAVSFLLPLAGLTEGPVGRALCWRHRQKTLRHARMLPSVPESHEQTHSGCVLAAESLIGYEHLIHTVERYL